MRTVQVRGQALAQLCGVALAAAFALSACGPTTGVDIEVDGADQLSADQIKVTATVRFIPASNPSGSTDAGLVSTNTVTAPDSPRALGDKEDLRITVSDQTAGARMDVAVQLLRGNSPVGGDPVMGSAIIVSGETKGLRFCFGPQGAVTGGCSPN